MSDFAPMVMTRQDGGFRRRWDDLHADDCGFRAPFAVDAPDAVLPDIDALLEEARADGFALGQQMARDAADDEAAQRERLIAALAHLQPLPPDSVMASLVAQLLSVMRGIIGDAPIDADLLGARCAAVIAACTGSAPVLHLHPDDVALLDLPEFGVAWVADSAVMRGSVRLEHEGGSIEHGIAPMLDELDRIWLGDAP